MCQSDPSVFVPFFSNSCSNSNWNWYCLKTVMFIFCACDWMSGLTFLMYLLRKKKPKHFVRYFYSSALPVQLNMYNVTVSLFFCWQMAWWLSWIARAGPLQLLKVVCWKDWSSIFFFINWLYKRTCVLSKCMTLAAGFKKYEEYMEYW